MDPSMESMDFHGIIMISLPPPLLQNYDDGVHGFVALSVGSYGKIMMLVYSRETFLQVELEKHVLGPKTPVGQLLRNF